MKNVPVTADEKRVEELVLSGELRPFCACELIGGNLQCTYFSACNHWRQLNKRTVKNSWLDRFLRAFVAKSMEGRCFPENMVDSALYPSVLFTPLESKQILTNLKKIIYSLQKKYSHPMALYVEGYKLREIADILEISLVSVIMRVAYARRQVLTILGDHPMISLKITSDHLGDTPIE